MRSDAKSAAENILANGPQFIESLQTLLSTHFPYGASDLSKAEEAFAAATPNIYSSNPLLSTSIPASRDAIYIALSHVEIIRRFITLHIPKIEDGNNFGVGIQLTLTERISKVMEGWAADLAKIPTYYSERSGCEEKLGLEKVSTSETTTSSEIKSTGGKDGDEAKTSDSSAKETKVVKSKPVPDVSCVKALIAKDVQFYAELRSAVVKVSDQYMFLMDAMEKNKDKISAPKGEGRGNAMSMF